MALSEKQKVRAKWVGLFKSVSIVASFGLIGWSGYALVNFKPVDPDAKLKKSVISGAIAGGTATEIAGADALTHKTAAGLSAVPKAE